MRTALACLLILATTACGGRADDGVVDVAFITGADALFAQGVRLESAGQHLRAGQSQGLVRLDAAGQVVPALAERWIVTDDGASYIFRIREFDLPGGTRLTAQTVRDELQRNVTSLGGTSMGLDLAKIADIRAMTGRVIEIRLKSPMPGLLQLLAQPELGVVLGKSPTGIMRLVRDGDVAVLNALAPEERGLPIQPEWDADLHQVRVYAADAAAATAGFAGGKYDMVLGGQIATMPLADTGALSRGTVRLDSAIGLFGLDIIQREGFLAQRENREALAMAIDRDKLLTPFNIGGWIPTTRIVAPGMPGDSETVAERWEDMSLDQRRARAASRVRQWAAGNGGAPTLRISLPAGPGSDLLFQSLERDFAAIGITASQVAPGAKADLLLRDRVARYGAARWFLNQFNCRVASTVCVVEADALVARTLTTQDMAEEAALLDEAEVLLTAANFYIPLGAPIRWSLVRAGTVGFTENPWSFHPLFPLSRAPM
ncbi:ABC transporter substrate-binding protein [Qipengyuania marisflavi]|uniref:Peptide ABC transporter substrate-binding protein n=1 Tax=Qipengyuania marisflavi TaxID=2486356 RepID=A0A5S3P556_9SPHN|nr:ABC transporter substrate-binding protein [Qipengyuania marisflavi]TMM48046.1 peptide ABC transporter substrate-binding protein [Qipengyuania marisflavi]